MEENGAMTETEGVEYGNTWHWRENTRYGYPTQSTITILGGNPYQLTNGDRQLNLSNPDTNGTVESSSVGVLISGVKLHARNCSLLERCPVSGVSLERSKTHFDTHTTLSRNCSTEPGMEQRRVKGWDKSNRLPSVPNQDSMRSVSRRAMSILCLSPPVTGVMADSWAGGGGKRCIGRWLGAIPIS